jgi:hypothetical protein
MLPAPRKFTPTVTVGLWLSGSPLIMADTVFTSDVVELSVPVATPPALVGPAGWVSVLPVPVAAKFTVAPLTGFPFASRAATLIVVAGPPMTMVGAVSVTADCAVDSAPAVTATPTGCARAVPFTVADTVFVSATVEASVPVATPLGLVGPAGCVSAFPLPDAANTTVAPAIGLPAPSRAVTVIVAGPAPAVKLAGAAATLDCVADTTPVVTVTVAVCVTAVPLSAAEIVFVSATVELSVPVATPLALVGLAGWPTVLPLPLAASTAVAPATGFPFASRAVTVIVAAPPPAATLAGAAVSVDCADDTAPAATVTAATCVTADPFTLAETVFVSATVDPSVPVATPFAPVGPAGSVTVFPLPVAATATATPLTGFPKPSFAVTVIVVGAPPAAIVGGPAATVD